MLLVDFLDLVTAEHVVVCEGYGGTLFEGDSAGLAYGISHGECNDWIDSAYEYDIASFTVNSAEVQDDGTVFVFCDTGY